MKRMIKASSDDAIFLPMEYVKLEDSMFKNGRYSFETGTTSLAELVYYWKEYRDTEIDVEYATDNYILIIGKRTYREHIISNIIGFEDRSNLNAYLRDIVGQEYDWMNKQISAGKDTVDMNINYSIIDFSVPEEVEHGTFSVTNYNNKVLIHKYNDIR